MGRYKPIPSVTTASAASVCTDCGCLVWIQPIHDDVCPGNKP
jgi:hypothetical protein